MQDGMELEPLTERDVGGGVRQPTVGHRAAPVRGVGRADAEDRVPYRSSGDA